MLFKVKSKARHQEDKKVEKKGRGGGSRNVKE